MAVNIREGFQYINTIIGNTAGQQRPQPTNHVRFHTPTWVQAGQREAPEIGLYYYVARY